VGELIDVTMWLKNQLENVRDFVQHSLAEKARDNNRSNGPSYDGDDDISMYGDSVKPTYGLGEVKKRRGVSTHDPLLSFDFLGRGAKVFHSVRHHRDDAIVAIASIPPNGDEDRTAQGHYATPVGCTMPSSSANGRWNNDQSAPRLLRKDLDFFVLPPSSASNYIS
jgi:hypothetical protein